MSLPLLVFTTVATAEQARALARALVERRLAACVQISAIDSVYRWQGALHEDGEFRLLFKTSAARAPALMAAIRELHPYELPALHAVATMLADPAYADWVEESCSDEGA
jgi:periplasmic divalent cation tolerance protein